jgi:hypothetical protein
VDEKGHVHGTMPVDGDASFPALSADGRHVACLVRRSGEPRLWMPAGWIGSANAPVVYGSLAFSPYGKRLYCAQPREHGVLDLWLRKPEGSAVRLTRFARDSYAPSVARDGGVLFTLEEYQTVLGQVDVQGGATLPLASFFSETPSWHPSRRQLGVIYGNWLRVVDDFRYPDIAQIQFLLDTVARKALSELSTFSVSTSESRTA